MGLLSARRSEGFLWTTCRCLFSGPWGPGREVCDVIGLISSTAWYAAMRGLPRCRDLSNSILVHQSTLTQSRGGRSMSLAKSILSQNVCRVRVCKRHLLPARDRKAPNGRDIIFMEDVSAWVCFYISIFCEMRWLSFDGSALDFESDFPDHSAQLAGDGDLDLVVVQEPFAKVAEAQVEPVLRRPGNLPDPAWQTLLSFG